MAAATSSRLSVVSAPPPYSPGQVPSFHGQQPTLYQPTAINVPAYHFDGSPNYATLDAKVDPYSHQQQGTLTGWNKHQNVPADGTIQTVRAFDPRVSVHVLSTAPTAENILPPPIPRKEVAAPLSKSAADPWTQGSNETSTNMDVLIADIDGQLSLTDTSSSLQNVSNTPLSFKAGPIVTHYELEGGEEMTQPRVYQSPQGVNDTQQLTTSRVGENHVLQVSQTIAVSPEQPAVCFEPRPQGHIHSPSAQRIDSGHIYSHEQQLLAPPQRLPMTPQSTNSSSHSQSSQHGTYFAQPEQIRQTTPLPERYVPTPMTPPSNDLGPLTHQQQQPTQPQIPYVPTPMTPSTPHSYYQQPSGQAQAYFPPPPPAAFTLPYEASKPAMSKRKSIMAAVALKASQTLSQHRTPSASSYSQPQLPASGPQPQGQFQQSQPVPQQPQNHQTYQQYHSQAQPSTPQPQPEPQQQQHQAHQTWPHAQQQAYHNSNYHQSTHNVEEPMYAPVPVPQAYSTRPQSQIFPPTPISPPNIPTVQYSQQQEPGYFPPPAECKPGNFSLPANTPISPPYQGQGYYLQR